MLLAAEHFGWAKAANAIRGPEGLKNLLSKLTEAIAETSSPLRVRTLLNHEGEITIETSATPATTEFNLFPRRLPPPRPAEKRMVVSPLTGGALSLGPCDSVHGDPPTSDPWLVLPDTVRIAPSPYTSYKTTSRDMYTSARERVGILEMGEKKEVLIVSDEGEIMEGSLTSVFFWREGNWVTPNVKSGGQVGTTRRWALQKGMCVEGVVRVDELVDGEECWISNGVRGFQAGKVIVG